MTVGALAVLLKQLAAAPLAKLLKWVLHATLGAYLGAKGCGTLAALL